MKYKYVSYYFLAIALGALFMTVRDTPPAGLAWQIFFDEPASPASKGLFLVSSYLWPAILSFMAIGLFQLQFRLSMSGASKCTVFSVCLLASLATLLGLQRLSMTPNSTPGYALGMALGYLTMSRLYGVRMRPAWWGISIPSIIWRGNREGVRQLDLLAAQTREARAKAAGADSSTQRSTFNS